MILFRNGKTYQQLLRRVADLEKEVSSTRRDLNNSLSKVRDIERDLTATKDNTEKVLYSHACVDSQSPPGLFHIWRALDDRLHLDIYSLRNPTKVNLTYVPDVVCTRLRITLNDGGVYIAERYPDD